MCENDHYLHRVCDYLEYDLSCFRSTRFATFPDYLMVQMKKFTLGDDWVPKKLGKNVTSLTNTLSTPTEHV